MFSSVSVGRRMALGQGATSGFDYMRLVLAVGVMAWHAVMVARGQAVGQAYQAGPEGGAIRLILPMFFALSGFLVSSSLERTRSLVVFVSFRMLRIIPALAVEVVLSALILGPLVTTVPVDQYIADPVFQSYFLNILGLIHYHLPGVFLDNPWPDIVNASLWTVPYELECYVALIVVSLLTLTRQPGVMGLFVIGLSVGFFLLFGKASTDAVAIDPIPGRMLVVSFLSGVVIYVARDRLPYSAVLSFICAVGSFVALSLPSTQYLATLPIAYVTVWLGLRDPPRLRWLLSGDYSYGIYLYGFVIQQFLMHEFAQHGLSAGSLLLTSVAATAPFAFCSWHLIEKPALRLKRVLAQGSASTSRPRARNISSLGSPARLWRRPYHTTRSQWLERSNRTIEGAPKAELPNVQPRHK